MQRCTHPGLTLRPLRLSTNWTDLRGTQWRKGLPFPAAWRFLLNSCSWMMLWRGGRWNQVCTRQQTLLANFINDLWLLLWFCFFFPVVPNPMESHHIFFIFTFIKGISLNLFYTCIYFNVYFGYFCDWLSFQGLLPYLLVASNQTNTIWADPTL